MYAVGLAEVDITPDYPIRLSGYGGRREETVEIVSRLYAKAMAIGTDKPVLLITLDNCGVTKSFSDRIAERIMASTGLKRSDILLCYSHTHTAPCLSGAAPMLFSSDIPAAHQASIDRYTEEVEKKLIQIGLAALGKRIPCNISYTRGNAGFAVNRRRQVGPVDHAMPMLEIRDLSGAIMAVWVSYACHCTTLGPDDNYMCGDWAGYAASAIERDHPGVTAFVTIGCAANANPYPRTGLHDAQQHGADIAYEASRLLEDGGKSLNSEIFSRYQVIDLPFDTIPDQAHWHNQAIEDSPAGYHAQKWLDKIEAGESIPITEPYPIQTWVFGDELAMVFLAGEVVADFTCRLRRIFDPNRLWSGAYANAFSGYIPSRRIWHEGGYEGGDATVYFGMPAKYAETVEDIVIETIIEMLPPEFQRA